MKKSPKEETLLQLATKINEAGSEMRSATQKFGSLLVEAAERVKRESNLSFRAWCKNYVFKPDGTQYSIKTIENAMWYARNPKAALRDKSIRAIRDKRRKWKSGHLALILNSSNLSEEDQVNLLVAAWDKASERAQRQFLNLINAQPMQRNLKKVAP